MWSCIGLPWIFFYHFKKWSYTFIQYQSDKFKFSFLFNIFISIVILYTFRWRSHTKLTWDNKIVHGVVHSILFMMNFRSSLFRCSFYSDNTRQNHIETLKYGVNSENKLVRCLRLVSRARLPNIGSRSWLIVNIWFGPLNFGFNTV